MSGKVSSSNIQAPKKFQLSNSERVTTRDCSLVEVWSFFGCWSPDFGAFLIFRRFNSAKLLFGAADVGFPRAAHGEKFLLSM